MRCEHCHTLVEGSNGTCPLCGAPLEKSESVFPPRKANVVAPKKDDLTLPAHMI